MKHVNKFILNTTFAFLAVGSLGASVTAFAVDPNPLLPVVIKIKPEHVFIPPGFDSNDNAQLVVTGALRNTCYKEGATKARVDQDAKKIYITQEAFKYNSAWCAELMSDYVKTVDLGLVNEGKYQVLVNDGEDKPVAVGIMNIAENKVAEPDSNTYAPVEEVVITNKDGKRTLTLRGTLQSRCTKLDQIKILERAPGVIEVLPITDLKDGMRCAREKVDFDQTVALPDVSGPTLVHIRSLSGGSVNRVIDL